MDLGFSLIHLSDPHFGGMADMSQIEALEALIPDLEPRLIVIAGDVTQRARHGEFQCARGFVRAMERTAPVYLVPGNHDVQWWWRPFIPFGGSVKHSKYVEYFGSDLTPTLESPEAVITGALTAHGVAWGSLTPRLRDIAVKGHLPKNEIRRVKQVFDRADEIKTRVLVLHHNVLRGDVSERMGLARWKQAQRRIVESGADLVLCGHDHDGRIDELDGVVVACAGTLSTRSRAGKPPVFFRISFDEQGIHAEEYRWNQPTQMFRRADVYAFAKRRPARPVRVTSSAG